MFLLLCFVVFFFNDTATTEIYTLSLHDALPISSAPAAAGPRGGMPIRRTCSARDRKSTRLNSSHVEISYAVFCLKKKNTRVAKGYSLALLFGITLGFFLGVPKIFRSFFFPFIPVLGPFSLSPCLPLLFFFMMRRPPRAPLFPYTTLFR